MFITSNKICKALKKFSWKTIAVILVISLVFSGLPFFPKKAFADQQDKPKIKNFVPNKVIKDDIDIGGVQCSLVGHLGVNYLKDDSTDKYEDYFMYYDITPNNSNDYFPNDHATWKPDKDFKFHVLSNINSHMLADSYRDFNKIAQSFLDNLGANLEIDDNSTTGTVGFFLTSVGGFLSIPSFTILILGIMKFGYMAKTAIIEGSIFSAICIALILAGVICLASYTDPVYDQPISEIGFKNKKGYIDIDACEDADDGLRIAALKDDELKGGCEIEFFDDDDYRIDEAQCNKLLISAGGNLWDSRKGEKYLYDYYLQGRELEKEYINMVNNLSIKSNLLISHGGGELFRNSLQRSLLFNDEDFKNYVQILFFILSYSDNDNITSHIDNDLVQLFSKLEIDVAKNMCSEARTKIYDYFGCSNTYNGNLSDFLHIIKTCQCDLDSTMAYILYLCDNKEPEDAISALKDSYVGQNSALLNLCYYSQVPEIKDALKEADFSCNQDTYEAFYFYLCMANILQHTEFPNSTIEQIRYSVSQYSIERVIESDPINKIHNIYLDWESSTHLILNAFNNIEISESDALENNPTHPLYTEIHNVIILGNKAIHYKGETDAEWLNDHIPYEIREFYQQASSIFEQEKSEYQKLIELYLLVREYEKFIIE